MYSCLLAFCNAVQHTDKESSHSFNVFIGTAQKEYISLLPQNTSIIPSGKTEISQIQKLKQILSGADTLSPSVASYVYNIISSHFVTEVLILKTDLVLDYLDYSGANTSNVTYLTSLAALTCFLVKLLQCQRYEVPNNQTGTKHFYCISIVTL